MNQKYSIIIFLVLVVIFVESKRTMARGAGSRSSSRTTSRKTSKPQPAPTSLSYPQNSAAKPSMTGWQERPAQKSNTQTLSSWQSKPSSGQSHSYPSSGTGLSGDKSKPHQESTIQRSSASSNQSPQQTQTNNQAGHSYPASTGLSGGSAGGYPQQNGNKYPQQQATGLSGNTGSSQHGYPQSTGLSGSGQHGANPQQAPGNQYPHQAPGAPPPYPGQNNYGYNSHHPQGPPPPYSPGYGANYGGVGGHGSYNPSYGSQMPGYFGNYGKNYGSVSRGPSVLTGVGIAGAGIGTVLTGLALWNLARSTGHQQHTVIYDNRGQPVAVAPGNDTTVVPDSILADLVNCSLTISNEEKTDVVAIPCAIATSFTPDADVKEAGLTGNNDDKTKCTVSVLTKAGKEYMTTIPCSILLSTAAANNVTEPPPEVFNENVNINNNATAAVVDGAVLNGTDKNIESSPLQLRQEVNNDNNTKINYNCSEIPEELRDPINPCYAVNHNLTVAPLSP